MKRRASWPYPRNTQEVIQVVMVALALLLVGLIGTAAQAEHYANKPLNRDNLQQAASSLKGYAAEAAIITDQAAHGRSVQTYQRRYLEQLGNQAKQVTEFLEAHRAPGALAGPSRQVTDFGHELGTTLQNAAEQNRSGSLLQSQRNFERLHDRLGQAGDNL